MGVWFWVGLAALAGVLWFMGFFATLVVQRHHETKPKKKDEGVPIAENGAENNTSALLVRRRSSAHAKPANDASSTTTIPVENGGAARRLSAMNISTTTTTATTSSNPVEGRRPSFQTNSPPSPLPVSGEGTRRSSLFFTTPAPTEGRRPSFQPQQQITPPPATSPSPPPQSTAPSSPRTVQVRKQSTTKGVSFQTPESQSRTSAASTSSSGMPGVFVLEEFGGHADAVESAAFSEEGLLATGGGPEDVSVKIYNRGVGTIGPLRHTINVQRDCGKHDGASVINFAFDEGKKSTLLLVGTRSERFLLGYKISKSTGTAPLLVFTFETKHGSPLAGVVGFIPKEATNFFDPGVFLATCARGTREVKVWSPKGAALVVIDCECWTSGLRLSPHGRHLAVLSSGGGPGIVLDVKKDKHHHLKFAKSKLVLPIDAGASPPILSPQLSNRRSVLGDLALQAAQDLVFHPDDVGASLACCRVDVAVQIAHVSDIGTSTAWEIETLVKPEPLSAVSPTHTCVLVPKADGRATRAIVARGKSVFFLDAALTVIGALDGRREDGDVIGLALSPKADFVVIVAFGASVARIVTIT